jgi:hypothetical protein
MKLSRLLTLGCLAISFSLPSIAGDQTKKEINFSGTHYWSGTPKVFPIDADRILLQMEIFGVRVNDSNDGPLNGAATYIAVLHYTRWLCIQQNFRF